MTATRFEGRAFSGAIASGVSFVSTLAVSILQVGFVLRFWPAETYGAWVTVVAAGTLLTCLDLGHQAYVGNRLIRELQTDPAAAKVTLASSLRVCGVSVLLQGLIAVALVSNEPLLRLVGVDVAASAELRASILIYCFGWMLTGSVGSILVRIYAPRGRFARSVYWAVVTRIVLMAVLLCVAAAGGGLVTAAVATAVAMSSLSLIVFWDLRRLFPDLYPWWVGGDWKTGWGNLARSTVFTATSLMDTGAQNGSVLLVARGMGAAEVPAFTTVRTLSNIAMQATSLLLQPITPDLVRYHTQRENGKLGGVLSLYWLLTCATATMGVCVSPLFVEAVYDVWTAEKLGLDRALFAWSACAVLLRVVGTPFVTLLNSTNHLGGSLAVSVVRTVVLLGGSLLGLKLIGLSGIGVAIAASELLGTLVVGGCLAYRTLGEPVAVRSLGYACLGVSGAALAAGSFAAELSWTPAAVAGGSVLAAFAAWMMVNDVSSEVWSRVLSFVPKTLSQRIRSLLPITPFR